MSNDSNNKAAGGGIGFCGLLTVAFIVLKLCHVINWSWLWVLSPLWIPVALVLLIILIIFIIELIKAAIRGKRGEL